MNIISNIRRWNTTGAVGLYLNKKFGFFIVLGLMTLAVFVFVEWPLITVDDSSHRRLLTMKWLLLPHVLCGLTGLVLGPLQQMT